MAETTQTISEKIASPKNKRTGSVTKNTIGRGVRESITKSYFNHDKTLIRGIEHGTGIDRENDRYVQWVNIRDFEAYPERYDLFNVLRRKDVYGEDSAKNAFSSKHSPDSPLINNDLIAVWMPLDDYYELRKQIEARNRAPMRDVLSKKPNQIHDREAQITVTHAEESLVTI